MKYDNEVKQKVRLLRRRGISLNDICKQTNVPKTTIRGWIRDIKLTSIQKGELQKKVFRALQDGRIKTIREQTNKKNKLQEQLFTLGKSDIGVLNSRELFLTGVALYWAEGFKNQHEHRLGFCNSDPTMIIFYIYWVKKALKVKTSDVTLRLTLNMAYENQEDKIKRFWSKITGIPSSQFTKTFYQHSLWKRQYKQENYHGVLRIHIKESMKYLLKMRGWIEGLREQIR